MLPSYYVLTKQLINASMVNFILRKAPCFYKSQCFLRRSYVPCSRVKKFYSTSTSTDSILHHPMFTSYIECLKHQQKQNNGDLSSSYEDFDIIRVSKIIQLYDQARSYEDELAELCTLNQHGDPEMDVLVKMDKKEYGRKLEEIELELIDTVLPVSQYNTDNNDIILDASSGAGGQEAMLFTKEICNMYRNYIAYKGWRSQILKEDASDIGGLRSSTIEVSGRGAYTWLRHEAGVHRVQRTPKTEKAGRLHTSTMAVTVMPKPQQIQVVLNNKDIRIDVCRASGPGGQHVNKTESAVRVTHIPTGIAVERQTDRSQETNKKNAMEALRLKLFQQELESRDKNLHYSRKTQVGSLERAEKIRTYNFQQDRVTDHRIGMTVHHLPQFMSGGEALDDMITNVREIHQRQLVLTVCQEHVDNYRQSKSERKDSG